MYSKILNLSRLSASGTPAGSWLQSLMVWGKKEVLYTDVLVYGMKKLREWPLVLNDVFLR